MTRKLKVYLVAIALLSCALGSQAGAVVLWDQSTLDLNGPGIANSNSSGFNGFVAYSVNDVTLSSNCVITRITQYYSAFNSSWLNLTQGRVYIEPKTQSLPTVAPGGGSLIPMSAASATIQGQPVIVVTASGLSIPLSPGEYWIGITPTAGAGINGANLQWPAAMVGTPVATFFSPAGPWNNTYGSYDGTLLIEGELPVPVAPATWGGVKSLFD
jgi:hypothetical protein